MRDIQEVAELAEERARRDDPEADPHAPDVAAEHRDDLVPEQLSQGRIPYQRKGQRTDYEASPSLSSRL